MKNIKYILTLLIINTLFTTLPAAATDNGIYKNTSSPVLKANIIPTSPSDVKDPFIKISFPSEDGLLVSGNLYEIDPSKPIILLCHQARYNKYEYNEIAPMLNELGFNCLAIDQRSGGELKDHHNETAIRAIKKGIMQLDYIDAEQDMRAAIEYLHKRYNKKIIIWGSSYSSSLALFIAHKNPHVSAAISFSPGDYFGNAKVPLKNIMSSFSKDFFITSSKREAGRISTILSGVSMSLSRVQFTPSGDGYHGSKALWNDQVGGEEYWQAIRSFLDTLK